MFEHGVTRLLVALLIGTWMASSARTVLAQEHAPEPPVPQENCINCPHRGVEGMGETITEVGSQKCPRVTLGIHIPFVGDVSIRIAGGTCPMELERVDAHNEQVDKLCYTIIAHPIDPSYDVSRKTVRCIQNLNLIVIASNACDYSAPWFVQTQRVNPGEDLCETPGGGGSV